MKEKLRVAALADTHYSRTSQGSLLPLFAQVSESADVLLLGGDLTDYGLIEEAQILAKDLHAGIRIPIIAVLGNHDFESGQQEAIREIMLEAGVSMLDGETCEVRGVGFAGGFDKHLVVPWGEDIIKGFVQEAVNEALKLEAALAKLRNEQRVALLHYAPIRATVEGENPEIFAFGGCSRLEEPLNHYQVAAASHGHVHYGSPAGKTSKEVPVYNVSIPVLQRAFPDRPPFCLFEMPFDA
jgi:Icc-related predicted phosphoesterase